MKQLIITVDPDGTTTVKACGFTGKACEDATRQIEEALGVVKKREHTKERFAQVALQQKIVNN